jgi:hypothetical protein
MKRSLPLLCLLLVLSGCTPAEQPQQQDGPAELRAFSSAADLKDYLMEQFFGPDTRTSLEVWLDNLQGKTRAPATMPSHYPGTIDPYDPVTVSVGGFAGTDPQALRKTEIDTVRLVGDTLYALGDYDLSIIKALPADQMAILGRFQTQSAPVGLYPLDSGRLVVLSSGITPYYYSYLGSDLAWLPGMDPYFDVYVLDVGDPTAPTALARYSIQGNLITARVIDGTRLVLLSASYPGGDPYEPPRDITYTAAADLLPTCRLTDAAGKQIVKPLLTWDRVLRPANPDGGAILTLSTIDLTNPGAVPTSVGMVGYWDTAYATPTSLYLANAAVMADGTYRSDTELHRFDLTGQTARYVGSIKLPGRPFWRAFSEKDGLLRVVTTSLDLLADYTVSTKPHLFVLDPADTTLQLVGQLDNFTSNSQIIGVEYIGNYVGFSTFDGQAYLSILVDLADPQQPTSLGPISVSPYADYVHLLDETHALTIGPNTTDPDDFSIFSANFALMMYDVPSAAGTTLSHSHTVGSDGTHSSIFISSREEVYLSDGLLILPVDLYEAATPGGPSHRTFGGLYLYRIAPESGFTPLGRIETADPYVYVAWTRAILKDNILYAVTNAAVQAAPLETPGQVLSKVRLP